MTEDKRQARPQMPLWADEKVGIDLRNQLANLRYFHIGRVRPDLCLGVTALVAEQI